MGLENNWYVIRDQKRWGPYTWQQLIEMVKGGQLGPDDQLWHSQYPNKISANQLQGLSEIFKSRDSTSQEILPSMVTTAQELPSWRITKSFGIVQSLVVNKFGIGTPITAITSGMKGAIYQLSQPTIGEAYRSLLQIAAQYGANAIIGFRFNNNEYGCLAYGTAVLAEAAEKDNIKI
jgi:uncharacterized protein YbjQ (UPF0145 family)